MGHSCFFAKWRDRKMRFYIEKHCSKAAFDQPNSSFDGAI
jgi:hypothetical protein